MEWSNFTKCGGCSYSFLDETIYKEEKFARFKQILQGLNQAEISFAEPIFISKDTRRRASFVFSCDKNGLKLGFNEKSSHNIVPINHCPILTSRINNNLEIIQNLILKICKTPIITKPIKKGKVQTSQISNGDLIITDADNGLDIVIETEENLVLDHNMTIFEFLQNNTDILRISHRKNMFNTAELVAEKTKPTIKIADTDVFISAGTFLQASKEGEQALIRTVMKYVGNDKANIADLFCGIGTFSYPLAKDRNRKILAVDSSKSLLEGFKKSINKNMLPNIETLERNLFKYPLNENELKNFDIIILDPPRAGAIEQISFIKDTKKIIYISCNPKSFIKDANTLINNGYTADEITFIDQFTNSDHFELVALFTKQS